MPKDFLTTDHEIKYLNPAAAWYREKMAENKNFIGLINSKSTVDRFLDN
jgi:hypothetical protein